MEPAHPTSTITDLPELEPYSYTYDHEEYEEQEQEQDEEDKYLIPKLDSLQADLIYNSIRTLCYPIISLFSIATETYHQAEAAKKTVESTVHKAPSAAVLLVKKLGSGVLSAAYVCMVLLMLLIVATIVGVTLVRHWLEEPVVVRERLHFDYTEAHPTAVFVFGGSGALQGLAAGSGADYFKSISGNKHMVEEVPVGHTFSVSMVLLMPESDFNWGIGVFQMSAELLSKNGDVIAKSSQPCMLRFRSLPIRVTRTFLMGVPLLLGISAETQMISLQVLRHKEGTYPRTRAIRVTLSPRSGTSYLPQLYEAEIVLNSQLPWTKQLVRSWRWTLYVWTSLYCYMMFILIFVTCCRPFLSPMTVITTVAKYVTDRRRAATDHIERNQCPSTEVWQRRQFRLPKDAATRPRPDDDQSEDIGELLRKWQRSRSKRKAIYMQTDAPTETLGTSSAPSTISMSTREDASTVAAEEDVGDSESVCT